jgi:hypothetical protein
MKSLKRKLVFLIESFRRGKIHRNYERSMRQIRIRDRKYHISKDLMLGHHLGEYHLQPSEIEGINSTWTASSPIPLTTLVAIHKKYRG